MKNQKKKKRKTFAAFQKCKIFYFVHGLMCNGEILKNNFIENYNTDIIYNDSSEVDIALFLFLIWLGFFR